VYINKKLLVQIIYGYAANKQETVGSHNKLNNLDKNWFLLIYRTWSQIMNNVFCESHKNLDEPICKSIANRYEKINSPFLCWGRELFNYF